MPGATNRMLLIVLMSCLATASLSDSRAGDSFAMLSDDEGKDVLKPNRSGSGRAVPGLELSPQDVTANQSPDATDGSATSPASEPVTVPQGNSVGQSDREAARQNENPPSQIGSYFYLNHRGGGQFGQSHPDTAFGMFYPLNVGDGLWFVQPQLALDNDGQFGSGVSMGRRWFVEPADRVFGAALSLDAYQTRLNEVAPQGVLSLETRGQVWDLFANGYVPLGDRTQYAGTAAYGPVNFAGNNLVANVLRNAATSMSGCDVQLASRISDLNLWGFGGWYHFEGGGRSTDGFLTGIRGYPGDRIALDGTVSDDPLFGTNVGFSATLFFGGTSGGRVAPSSNFRRMAEPLNRRDSSVQFERQVVTGMQVLTRGGALVTVSHVNSSGVPGTGTVTSPFGSLTAGAGSPSDVIFVHADSIFNGQQFSVQPGQRLLGEASGLTHLVLTDQMGPTILPQATGGLNAPLIQNSVGNAVTMSANSVVSGIRIQNAGAAGIFANTGGPILIDRVSVQGSAGAGVLLQVAGTDIMDATVTNSILTGNGAPSTFQFGPNAGALLNLNLAGNEDSNGFSFQRDPNGFLRLGGTLGTGNFFNDDNGNVANNGNTTLGGAPNTIIVGAGNQIQIVPPGSIVVP